MTMRTQAVGALGEDLAAAHLTARGYAILARNWRPVAGRGEIDIVAKQIDPSHADVYVFVEVRTRHGAAHGAPEETLDRRKRAKLIETGLRYLDAHDQRDAACRIDVIAIDLDARDRVRRLTHIENAIEDA